MGVSVLLKKHNTKVDEEMIRAEYKNYECTMDSKDETVYKWYKDYDMFKRIEKFYKEKFEGENMKDDYILVADEYMLEQILENHSHTLIQMATDRLSDFIFEPYEDEVYLMEQSVKIKELLDKTDFEKETIYFIRE